MRATSESTATHTDAERAAAWELLQRRAAYVGEQQTALLRLVAIAAFYAITLLAWSGIAPGFLELPPAKVLPVGYHERITLLVAAWTMLGLGAMFLARGSFSPRLGYATTALDLVMLVSVLCIAEGPRSPAVTGFFVILALAVLRCRASVVWFATGGALAGYLFLCGYARWFATRELNVPRYVQLTTFVALAVTGLALGCFLRFARRLPDEYAELLANVREREEAST